MADRKESRRASYWHCAVPAAAGLLVMVFMGPSLASGGWGPQPGGGERGQLDALLKPPPAAAARYGDALRAPLENYTVDKLNRAASVAGLGVWRFTTGLLLLVIVCGIFIAGFVINRAARAFPAARRRDLVALAFAFCFGLFLLLNVTGMVWQSTARVREFLGHIHDQMATSNLVEWELLLNFAGYVMALYLMCASGATLLPYRPRPGEPESAGDELESRARYYAAQMSHLRLLLYVGAVALAVVTLRARLNFTWALEYLPPLAVFAEKSAELLAARLLYERLDNIVANTATSLGILNTVVLAAIYVPAALILRERANDLAAERVKAAAASAAAAPPDAAWGALVGDLDSGGGGARRPPPPPGREEWLKARGLAFPLKEHLGRVAVILSPLLTGPISELLIFLKN